MSLAQTATTPANKSQRARNYAPSARVAHTNKKGRTMIIDKAILKTIESVKVETFERDAAMWLEAIETALNEFIYQAQSCPLLAVGYEKEELSCLVGDCGMSHFDAFRQLACDAAWWALLNGWAPDPSVANSSIAYHRNGMYEEITFERLSEVAQTLSVSVSAVVRTNGAKW